MIGTLQRSFVTCDATTFTMHLFSLKSGYTDLQLLNLTEMTIFEKTNILSR